MPRAMKKVVVLVQDGVEPFGLGAMCEVWAEPYHPDDDNPIFDFVVCPRARAGSRSSPATTCTSSRGSTRPPTPT